MFTGLIEEVGRLRTLARDEIVVRCDKVRDGVRIGDSIAINGACLSVTRILPDALAFHVSPVTAAHTRFRHGEIRADDEVNLERAMLATSRLDGHIVQGHVDGLARIVSIGRSGTDHLFEFLCPAPLRPLVAAKGSVAIDGVSLTVVEVLSSSFTVNVIPQTWELTTLHNRRQGDHVHLEVDVIARYVQRMLQTRGSHGPY